MERQRLRTDIPPMVPSDEATAEQLGLALQQGRAFGQAVQGMTKETGVLQSQEVGDYEIAVTAEKAEGLYMPEAHTSGAGEETLHWTLPLSENCHIEVVVSDAADGRFIPELPVQVTVYDPDGREIGSHRHPFLWHPWLYHYGRNWIVPRAGDYRIHVRVDPPQFPRHDHENGQRYAEPAEADFTIPIHTGQKTT